MKLYAPRLGKADWSSIWMDAEAPPFLGALWRGGPLSPRARPRWPSPRPRKPPLSPRGGPSPRPRPPRKPPLPPARSVGST